MAIKERKQITGTTAQIQAYAGHEGQIVWDKDKKTFVGMSGTAGKNYPLASKEYVDTQFLPKSGGILLGGAVDLQSEDGNATAQFLRSGYKSEFEGVDIISEVSNWDSGAILSLRANSCATKSEAGAFHIRTGKNPYVLFLKGQPDGHLTWDNKEIERVSQITKNEVEFPDNSVQSYIRFESGLQLVFGTAKINGLITQQKRVNYAVPFISVARVIAGSDAHVGLNYNVGVGWQSGTGFSIGTDYDGANGWCSWIAVGIWK